MNFKKISVIFIIIIIALISISFCAAEDINTDDINLSQENLLINESSSIQYDSNFEELSISSNDSILSSGKVITVDGSSVKQMNNPTIQNAIDSANEGDIINITGTYYEHCHFIVNKKLTIISSVGTIMSPCSSTYQSQHQGIFYITSKASGTVIDGFTIIDDLGLSDSEAYGVLINGASNVNIRNCNISTGDYADSIRIINAKNNIIQNVTVLESINAIKIVNSSNIIVDNSTVKKSRYGINIIESNETKISYNNISENIISGVSVSGKCYFTTISYNNITYQYTGVNLTSSNQVFILSNYIANNGFGVYVNCNITKIEIKGNFFNQNGIYEIYNDYRTRNLYAPGGEKLEVINNNYMIGINERPVYHNTFEYKGTNKGSYTYDSINDVYNYVGLNNGDYDSKKDGVFLGYVFEIDEYVYCPVIYYKYGKYSWSESGNYELQLSEITQIKKGIYSISIVDVNGNIASDISSVYVTFYINKNNDNVLPHDGEIYKTVLMQNGTATVRFYMDEFESSDNTITAVFPTPNSKLNSKISKTFNVSDSDIPGIITNTSISVSNLNTYPNSNQYLIATLKDENGKVISNETLTFKINSKTYNILTDINGQAKLKITENEGTYTVNVVFEGDEVEYFASSAKCNVVVKKQSTKIISSNFNMIPKMNDYYIITLKDTSGNVLSNQKVTFKVNSKTYTKTTNSKGQIKLKLKFTKQKTYKITISFKGNNKYKAISKTNTIKVKYSSKTAKLITPNLVIPPKTSKYYTVTLKDNDAKGISKQKVIIKINGKKYSKKTNNNGKINIKVKFNSLKKYKVTASYGGSKIYKKASSSGKISVSKIPTKLNTPSISILPNELKTYTVTLKTNDGKVLSKQKLNINVNGKTYTKTTNSNGQASISLKFTQEKSYTIKSTFKGTSIYKASTSSGKINVFKITTKLSSYNRTFSNDSIKNYTVTLKDASGNSLEGQKLIFTVNNESFDKTTDSSGKASIDLTNISDSFDISIIYGGSDKYKSVLKTNKITISDKLNTTFIDNGLPNEEIQNILDDCVGNVEFLGDYYSDISLNLKNNLNIYSNNKTILNASVKNPVFKITSSNVNISNFSIVGNLNDAVRIINSDDVSICDNLFSQGLKIENYLDGLKALPGYALGMYNSSNIIVSNNYISLFESGIFAQNTNDLIIDNNTISKNNYGIKYGFNVSNTQITHNNIIDSIGLYTMEVPEGPNGYGVFLNNSAVNVLINQNYIVSNHIGISIDANHSTGIVITQNTISDNVLEGIRFNAGYDLALNAIEPIVMDNAIYRNARGPSMMILGELSANPNGIYGNGLYNDSAKLNIGANWYGTNNLVTWDNDTGIVGFGTMCPRINTTAIKFNNITCINPGNYSITFYRNDEIASNLPEFDLYATLNRNTDLEVEVNFKVINGVGIFSFNNENFNNTNNTIEISIGSLINESYRIYKVIYDYLIPENEILI